MGQKVHPIAFRVGVYRDWDARWYADKDYTKLLHEDLAMRRLITGRLRNAGVARIQTERGANQLTVVIQTAKPGIVIGKQGASVDALRDELERITGKKVRVTIHEIKQPDLDAKLVAENVAGQLEKRIAFRRAIKQTLLRTMRAGAKGVKIQCSGRLGGAEMSRREWDREGRVPLHTLRADIDYGLAEARTTFGRIGVQCWIYKGDFVTATGERVLPPGARPQDDDGEGAAAGTATPAAAPPGAAVRAPRAAARTAKPPVPSPAVVEVVVDTDTEADVDNAVVAVDDAVSGNLSGNLSGLADADEVDDQGVSKGPVPIKTKAAAKPTVRKAPARKKPGTHSTASAAGPATGDEGE